MSRIDVFIILVVLLAAQAAWRGGAPERLTSIAMLIATAATALANVDAALPFRRVEWSLLWIDALLLATLVLIALLANRFWPIWLAGLQCLAVAAHGARGFDIQILPLAYWWLLGKLSYPMVLMLCVGIERHQWRKRSGMPEEPWSNRRPLEETF